MSGFGGMVSFDFVSGKKEDSVDFLRKLKYLLGRIIRGVESLANHPALMTHASIPEDKRKEVNYRDLVRLSVGVEDIEDLIEDFKTSVGIKKLYSDKTPNSNLDLGFCILFRNTISYCR
jgi:cystathionine beta-lyase